MAEYNRAVAERLGNKANAAKPDPALATGDEDTRRTTSTSIPDYADTGSSIPPDDEDTQTA